MSGRSTRKMLPTKTSVKPEYTTHFDDGFEETDLNPSVSFEKDPKFGKLKRTGSNGFIDVTEEMLNQETDSQELIDVTQQILNQYLSQNTSSSSPSIVSTLGSVSPTSLSLNDSLVEKAINEVVGESMLRTPRVYRRVKPEEKDSFKYIKNRQRNNEAVRRTREKNKVKKLLEEEKYEQLRKRYNAMIDALKKCRCGCATQFIMENCGKI
uniref:BZIP domain-containing protein n=1 Tax=Panagrolaimus superbus TaxID=310955 RepID=A0A914ZD31_9BILA